MQTEKNEAPLAEESVTEAPAIAPEGEIETSQAAALPAQVSRETENEARDMGWVPKEEWRGSADAWRPADEFVKRGKEVLPIIRSNLERERRKTHELEAKIADLPKQIEQSYADRFKRLEGMTRVALANQRDRMWSEFEAKKREAVEAGDAQAYDRHTAEQRKVLSDFQPEAEVEEAIRAEAPKKPESAPPTQAPPEVQAWVAENRWFNSDPALTAFATKEHGKLLKAMPGLSIEENLRRTLEATKQKFPEEFGLSASNGHAPPAQPHAPSVEGGGRQSQGVGKTRGWNDLPPEAKTSGDKFIRQDGLFLPKNVDPEAATEADIKKARDAYARDYWSLA